MKRGRRQFPFLAELFLASRDAQHGRAPLRAMLDDLARSLPDPREGATLKSDIIAGGGNPLPAINPVEVVSWLVEPGNDKAMPLPSSILSDRIRSAWPLHQVDLLSIAERAAREDSDAGALLLDLISSVADPETFLGSTDEQPALRRRLIRLRPELIDSDRLPGLATGDLIDLVGLVPTNSVVFPRVLQRCLAVDSTTFARWLHGVLKDELVDAVARATIWPQEGHQPVAPAFKELVRSEIPQAAGTGVFSRLKRWSEIRGLAELLGWDRPDVLRLGTHHWISALDMSQDDFQDPAPRLDLLAFLLAVGLSVSDRQAIRLFELTFEPLFLASRQQGLGGVALDILGRRTPHVGWSSGNLAERVCRAVARAYVSGELEGASFLRLAQHKEAIEALVAAVADSIGGKRYLKSLFNSGDDGRADDPKRSKRAR